MKNFILEKCNLTILIFYFLLCSFSIITIFLSELNNSITPKLFLKQIIFIIISFFIIYYMQKISIHNYEKLSIIFFIASIILLVIILITPENLAPNINGAKSWFDFKIFSFQPSELAKVSTVFLISSLIIKNHFKESSDVLKLIQIIIILTIPFLLIVKQNDFGNALYFIFLFLVMSFIVSKKNKTFIYIYSIIIFFITAIITIAIYIPNVLKIFGMHDYQLKRILSWLKPEDYAYNYSYQINNAIYEMKNAGLYGNFNKNTTYIPEQFNDFILTSIAKNFGFVGVCIFIIIYLIFLLKIINISRKCINGNFSYYVILLTTFNLCYSFILNSYSATGLIPVIGVSMPFISYGGSSLISNSILLGIILKINKTIYEEQEEDLNELE